MGGKTSGHYQITNQLIKGGMGEAYLADNFNLNKAWSRSGSRQRPSRESLKEWRAS